MKTIALTLTLLALVSCRQRLSQEQLPHGDAAQTLGWSESAEWKLYERAKPLVLGYDVWTYGEHLYCACVVRKTKQEYVDYAAFENRKDDTILRAIKAECRKEAGL